MTALAKALQETYPFSGHPFHLGGILGLREVPRSLTREVQWGDVCLCGLMPLGTG